MERRFLSEKSVLNTLERNVSCSNKQVIPNKKVIAVRATQVAIRATQVAVRATQEQIFHRLEKIRTTVFGFSDKIRSFVSDFEQLPEIYKTILLIRVSFILF